MSVLLLCNAWRSFATICEGVWSPRSYVRRDGLARKYKFCGNFTALTLAAAMEEERGNASIRFMPWAKLQSRTLPCESSRWGFFTNQSTISEMDEDILIPATSRPQISSLSSVDKLNPTLQCIFDWAEDQVDQNLEDAPILTSTDLDGLQKEDQVVNIHRRKQDLTVTLREDVWSAIVVFGARIVRKSPFLGVTTSRQEFLICLGHMRGLKVRWKPYKEIRRLLKLVEPLCLTGAIAVYNDLLKPTEKIFANSRDPHLLMTRLMGITTFVSQVLEEL